MFRVVDVILSEDIATSAFACDITRCKGACCVVGDAGAPVSKSEIPILNKAFRKLKSNLAPEAVNVAEEEGVVIGNSEDGYEINSVNGKECIFVQKDERGVATCAIQEAYYSGNFDWEKPISCHLYPIRLKKIAGMEFANFEYIPELCAAGCANGKETGTYLADFLETALVRRYGHDWFVAFNKACEELRKEEDLD